MVALVIVVVVGGERAAVESEGCVGMVIVVSSVLGCMRNLRGCTAQGLHANVRRARNAQPH